MASEDDLKFYNELLLKGCCKRCVLRYLGQQRWFLTFDHPNTTLVNLGYLSPMEEFSDEPESKKRKINPCSVCLGLLQDPLLNAMLEHEKLAEIGEYDNKNVVSYITFPICILIREHSMKIYLKRTFPGRFDAEKVINLNQAWRYSIQQRLCRTLKKKYDARALLSLHFYTKYMLEDDEMEAVRSYWGQYWPHERFSRHHIKAVLEGISDENFGRFISIPPKVPLYELTISAMKYNSEAIHLSGNYCKFSRQLAQVPVFEDGECVERHSIETIISNSLRTILGKFGQVTFQASSFDERDLRVLGNGRSFHLQLSDPKFDSVSRKQCREIETFINRTQEMQVKNLRQTERKNAMACLDTEQLSARSFKVLCIVYKCKNLDYCVNAVNMYKTVMVWQKTPLRFVERRDNRHKRKKIYHIKATKVKDNLMELDLCVQYGLYVPEFIHGDFGRTTPSLGEIMKAQVDVLAMDVVDFASILPCALEEEEVVF